jgi:hypothetical protein
MGRDPYQDPPISFVCGPDKTVGRYTPVVRSSAPSENTRVETPERVKVVSKRSGKADDVQDAEALQKLVNQLRGVGIAPRGVYRFETHEDASEWLIHQMAVLHARQSSKTSSSSAVG